MKYCIDIKGIGDYFPNHEIANDYYIDYYKNNGADVANLLNTFGRNVRHISDNNNENSVTMAANACKEALRRTGLSAGDIDLLIFSSGTPEYLAPANAVKVHNLIGGKDSAIVYDMNANCVGMIVAVEQASRYMMANDSVKYAMIVGSEQMNKYSQESDIVTKCNFGDAACAVILERSRRRGKTSGFIDAAYHVNSSYSSVMLFPQCGLSNIYRTDLPETEKRILWTGGAAGNGFALTKALIEALLRKYKMEPGSIKKYFISQISKQNIEDLADSMHEDISKFEYVGDKYGYTGTSSPFVAMDHAIRAKTISRKDNVIFWSIGTGYVSCAMLWKY